MGGLWLHTEPSYHLFRNSFFLQHSVTSLTQIGGVLKDDNPVSSRVFKRPNKSVEKKKPISGAYGHHIC